MALIKGNVLALISGKINGTVYAHNRGGAYARNLGLPTNPKTSRQSEVRTALTSLAKAWGQQLTEEERDLWRAYGASTTVQNRIGDQITLSGIAAFQRVNLFRLSTLGQPQVDVPPSGTPPGTPPPVFVSAESSGNTPSSPAELTINTNAASTGYSFAVYYSGYLSPGKRYYRGPWIDHVTQAITTATTTITLPNLVTSSAGGESFVAKVTCYETASGLPVWTIFTDPVVVNI